MFDTSIWQNNDLSQTLNEGKVAVMPTDTLYGIVGKAENADTVERIYQARKRNPTKPCIILISHENELSKFGILLSSKQKEGLKGYWSFGPAQDFQPGAVSIIFDCDKEEFEYLHRGTKTLAFRMPSDEDLRMLLSKTGPLVAPSANTEGEAPAKNIGDAKNYFGDTVDFYLDGGNIEGKASKVLKLKEDGSTEIIRD